MPNLLAILLFPIFPFLSFLIACTNLKSRVNGVVFVLFYSLFGFCHTFGDIRSDAFRKAENFASHFPERFPEIMQRLADGDIIDIYESILFSWLKGFTDDPHIMLMFVGLVAGFFILCTIRRVLSDYRGSYNACVYIIILMVILLLSPVHLGGVRNITALSIFAYSAIRFLVDRKNIWLIGIIITPLIHFSFILFAIFAIVARFVRVNGRVLVWPIVVVCLASMFISTSSWSGVVGVLESYIGNDAISYRAEIYTDEDVDIVFEQSLTTRIMRVQELLFSFYMIITLLYFKRNWSRFKVGDYSKRLFDLMAVFLLIGYVLISFSVVGSRYLNFGYILFYTVCLNLYQNNRNNRQLCNFIRVLPLVNIGNIAWTIYNAYCVVGVGIFYKPLVFLLL